MKWNFDAVWIEPKHLRFIKADPSIGVGFGASRLFRIEFEMHSHKLAFTLRT